MCVLYKYTNRQGFIPLKITVSAQKALQGLPSRQINIIFTKKPTEIWLSVARLEASQT